MPPKAKPTPTPAPAKHALLAAIAQRAEALGLTQAQLAERAGTTQPRLSLHFAGRSDIRLSTLVRLAHAVGCELVLQARK
jgi:transcriptional regulator with XRE-family HTH domain